MAQKTEQLDRRAFFGLAARAVTEAENRQIERQARRWFRPPFALAEVDFLTACTRCDDCIKACDPGVIFRLPEGAGPSAAGTPALDLLTRGCQMCEGWPCVAACEPGALRLPIDPNTAANPPAAVPFFGTARIDTATCLPFAGPECGACGDICPVSGALTWAGPRPSIVEEMCIGCGLCREACIVDAKAITITPVHHTIKAPANEEDATQ